MGATRRRPIRASAATRRCAWPTATTGTAPAPDERLVTIGQLRELNEGQSEQVRGPVLDDDQAYDVLEGQCEPEFAGAFKLYKLYGRAAAFLGH